MPQISRTTEHKHEVEEDDELCEIEPAEGNIYTQIQSLAESFASTRIGQFFISQGDRVLRSVELTAKWSLPKDQQKTTLSRPLPWIPFLMLLLILRSVRFWLSLASLMIGNDPVSPHDMVYFMQTRRRKLRSIRLHGLRALKQRENETNGLNLLRKVSKKLLSAVCCTSRNHQSQMETNILLLREHWCSEHAKLQQASSGGKKRTVCHHEEDLEDQNLSFEDKLAKYANEPSDEDSDFVPDEGSIEDDTSSSSESGSITDEEDDDEVTPHKTNKIDVEIENGKPTTQHVNIPKPMIIKSEPNTEKDVMTLKINGNHEGLNEKHNKVMEKEKYLMNIPEKKKDFDEKKEEFDEKKTTSGHMSAAKPKIKAPIMLNNTAAAGF